MQEKDFVSYEYRTVAVKASEQTAATDMYDAFGWEMTGTAVSPAGGVTLSMKRDRKQKHKQELNKLERQAEETFDAIHAMNRSKTLGASVFGYIFGSVSALILGGGMSLTMLMQDNTIAFAGGIILGVVGIALCSVCYPIYRHIAAKKTKKILPEIDRAEEKLANLLEKGNDLLNADLI